MRWLFRTDYRSFYLLNATQFLGALNDNIFKLLVIYLLINAQGPAAAPIILSIAGAVFVIPFLLFSAGAGVMADRFSKRSIIVSTKIMELVIMALALLAVLFESAWGSYTALFFMAAQSALFGPSKYGVIPELVEPKMVSKANGSMTSLTYLAIILGTFLASFLTDVTDKNFFLVGLFCVVIAAIGLLASLGIVRTQPQNSTKRINPVFLYEIYKTLKFSHSIRHLLPAIFGSSFFLFIGAFTQLNIIPFAIQSLHTSEVGGGYLFLSTAVGIAIGAVLAGQLSKDKVEPGISCICGFFISILFILIWLFSSSLWITVICLGFLGVFGGAFLIPFDAFIQVNSPDEKRGQMIAASNFMSFVGVLTAAFFLYLISEELGFSAASGFAAMGVLSFAATLVLTGRLSALFFPFFANKILKRLRRLKLASPIPEPHSVILLQHNSWWDAILLFSCLPQLQILLPDTYLHRFPWINGWFDSIRIVSLEADPEDLTHLLHPKSHPEQKTHFCLFIRKRSNGRAIVHSYLETFKRLHYPVFSVQSKKEKVEKRVLWIPYSAKQITMSFHREHV